MPVRRTTLAGISVLAIAAFAFAAGLLVHGHAAVAWPLAAVSVVLAATGLAGLWWVLARSDEDATHRRALRELLQVSASAEESQQLLIRHVERTQPGTGVVVLTRHDDEDRLEATTVSTAPHAESPLKGLRTRQLRRRSCLAIRLGGPQERHAGAEPLVRCDVCGAVPGEVVCEPLRAAGDVLGAVLVAGAQPMSAAARGALRESLAQAAPILAAQRNVELAEGRAVSDSLTGLPNRRAAEATIRRMIAHAGRTLSPLGILLVDLDHFDQVNARHGHEVGDRALTRVGEILAATVRASDFAARYGGEEFLVLLPDTDRVGAVEAAEKIRNAIEHADVPVVGTVTVSIGVAALPDDAVDPERLIRKADRALYAAKAKGRNRVQGVQPSGLGELQGDEPMGT